MAKKKTQHPRSWLLAFERARLLRLLDARPAITASYEVWHPAAGGAIGKGETEDEALRAASGWLRAKGVGERKIATELRERFWISVRRVFAASSAA